MKWVFSMTLCNGTPLYSVGLTASPSGQAGGRTVVGALTAEELRWVAEAGERRAPTFKAPHFEEEPVLTARAALPFQ